MKIKQTLSVRIEESQYNFIDSIAKRDNRSLGSIIRIMIDSEQKTGNLFSGGNVRTEKTCAAVVKEIEEYNQRIKKLLCKYEVEK